MIENDVVITHDSQETNRDGLPLGELIARVYEYSENDLSNIENFSNARLIAAAPDLLEACKKAVEYLEGIGLTQTEDGEEHPEYEMLRAAISRAEGETK